MRRVAVPLAMLALGAGVLGLGAGLGTAGSGVREGGTFRISIWPDNLDSVDPAFSYTPSGWALLSPVCARLMAYPDKPPPEGYRLVPEVAAGYPRVSHDQKTWAFTLRKGFRLSNGAPVRASAFARAINRTLAPRMDSPFALYTRAILGAEDVLAGKATAARGVVARGNTRSSSASRGPSPTLHYGLRAEHVPPPVSQQPQAPASGQLRDRRPALLRATGGTLAGTVTDQYLPWSPNGSTRAAPYCGRTSTSPPSA